MKDNSNIGNELILFETEDRAVTLTVPVNQEMVWLSRNQMAELFDRDIKTIGKHINNALKEELESSRREILIISRPLTPPCVRFRTRRFNQLNK